MESETEEIRAHYDAVGRSWRPIAEERPEPVGITKYWMDRKIEAAFRLGGFTADDRLLEIGCTTGHYTFYLGKRGYRVTGFDLSPEAIETANLSKAALGMSNVDFQCGDANHMDMLRDESFDGVFSFSVLRYVSDPVVSLREAFRVLKKGKYAVVDFPNVYCPWFVPIKRAVGIQTHIHDHLYSTAAVKRMMREAGFEDIRAERLLFTSKRLPDSLLPVCKSADAVLEKLPLVNQLAGIIMCRGRRPS